MLPMMQPPLQSLPAADHFLDGVQPPKDLLKRIGLLGKRQFLLNRIEQLPAPVHVPVQHREAQVLPVTEMVEERALGHLGGVQDLFQLRVVIPLEGEQAGRRLEDLLSGFQRSRLRDVFHRPSHKTG